MGLEITWPYKDLYSFDSKRVKCLSLIKDMVVSLNKLPSKTMVKDVVVADIPPKFGILLSRSWTSKLEGRLQMYMSYSTILFLNENKRLYSEKISPYVVRNQDQAEINHVYVVDIDLGSSVSFNDVSPCELSGKFVNTLIDDERADSENILDVEETKKGLLKHKS